MSDDEPPGPVFALRAWRVTADGKLQSTNFDCIWDGPGPHVAVHWMPATASTFRPAGWMPSVHGVRTCEQCGFHAYSTLEAAQKSCYTQDGMALGVILMWGDIASAECDRVAAHRFRASNALIVALQDDSDWSMKNIPSTEIYPVRRVPVSELQLFAACMFTDRGRSGIGT